MADVTYLGAGAYTAASQGSITPSLPSGLVAGDLMVLCASIRTLVATIDTPTGWTATTCWVDGSQIFGDPELYGQVFYRYFQEGDAAPVVSFTNGGQNETTQAQILGFQNTELTNPISLNPNDLGLNNTVNSFNNVVKQSVYGYITGDYLLGFWVANNNGALVTGGTGLFNVLGESAVRQPSIFVGGSSALGSNAAQAVFGGLSTVAIGSSPHHEIGVTYDPTVSSFGVFRTFSVKRLVPNPVQGGTGGAKVGGAANTRFVGLPPEVKYLGWGTYFSGNNTSLTPGLPPGANNGDFLLLIAAIREDLATIETPAGWTPGPVQVHGTAIGVEATLASFYKVYATGDVAPTVTFTGGGANDTTQAVILQFRGVRTVNPIARATAQTTLPMLGPGVTYEGPHYLDTTYGPGDYLLSTAIGDNDIAVTVNGSLVGNPAIATDFYSQVTLEGSDACLQLTGGVSRQSWPGTGNGVQTVNAQRVVAGNTANDAWIIYKPNYTSINVSYGRALVGGVATCVFVAGRKHTANGGVLVSGAATTSLRTATFLVTGSGGVLLTGTAITIKTQLPLIVIATGGIGVSGSASAIRQLSSPPHELKYQGLEFVLSGGNNNIVPGAAIGGLPSLVEGGSVSTQKVAGTINGIDIRSSTGMALGVGTLSYRAGYGVLSFVDSASQTFTTLLGGDGYYRLGGFVLKVVSSLLTQDVTRQITITENIGGILDNVEYSSRLAGDTDYHCIYVHNCDTVPHTNVVLTILTDPDYSDLTIGSEAGLNIGTTVDDLESAGSWWYDGPQLRATPLLVNSEPGLFTPFGLFKPVLGIVTPVQESYGLNSAAVKLVDDSTAHLLFDYVTWGTSMSMGTLNVGEYRHFWIKRIVPVDSGIGTLLDVGLFSLTYGD